MDRDDRLRADVLQAASRDDLFREAPRSGSLFNVDTPRVFRMRKGDP